MKIVEQDIGGFELELKAMIAKYEHRIGVLEKALKKLKELEVCLKK